MNTYPTPILLIDDDEDDYFITKDLLDEIERQSFRLDWVATYEAGLVAIKRQEHQAYLVDYRLGARSGLDLLREAIKAGIKAPIILLTGQGDQEVDLEAMTAGAADYLVKDQLDALLLERSLRYAIAQKQAERALRESEARYRNVTELISDYAYVLRLKEDGRPVLEWVTEEGFARVTGYTSADLDDIDDWPHISAYTHADDVPIVEAHWQQLLRGEQSVAEYRLITKDGSVCWLRVHVYPEWNAAQERVVFMYGVAQDITEQKQAETIRRQLEEQLQQAQKMEAIGRLAGGIAHDFNNALTIILTCSELLLRRYLDDPVQAREYVEEIKDAGERTALLTRQLLAFSRKQVMLPRLIYLNELIQNMEKMLSRLIGEDILFDTILRQDLGLIKADPSQLEQVLMNLVVNARDAMPTGGKLLVETKSTYLDEQYVQQRVGLKAGPYIVLAVSDTGEGMDKETMARIFEPFFTTKEVGKGTGLGLAMVYGIVQQSGGVIEVFSEPGLGTTFKVYLPQVHQSVTAVANDSPQPALRGGTETILVVEDEIAVRGLIDNILTEQGYVILKAGDGEEAIHITQQHEGVIHLLLTDVIMPGMSGQEIVQRLTAVRPNLKWLYVSGYTASIISHYGMLDANTPVFEKPFTPDALIRKVREVLDRQN